MKLSKREKVLIGILIIVVIGYFCYKSIPDLFNLNALKEEYDVKSNDYNIMSQNIVLKTKYEEQIQNLTKEINNLNYISDLQQEKLIVFLDSYFTNNNIKTYNINFTEATIVPVNLNSESSQHKTKSTFESMMDEINNSGALKNRSQVSNENKVITEQNVNSEENVETVQNDNQDLLQDSLTVKAITVSIAFECTYDNMIKFIDAIQNRPYDIQITNINTVTLISEAGNIIQGSMDLNFYEVPKVDNFKEKNADWIWKDL